MKLIKIFTIIFFGIIFIPIKSFTQEFTLKKTPEQKQQKQEDDYLKFQTNFFEALHQKAREDYNKAIEYLNNCKAIYPENAGLNFEYAKNYLKLKDYDNAIFFNEKALVKKPNNLAILNHLKESFKQQQDYKNAILIQKKMVAIKPSKENGLIYLYIINRQKDKAKETYFKLKKLGLLDLRKDYFNRILFPKKKKSMVKKPNDNLDVSVNTVSAKKEKYNQDKKFTSLLSLLELEEKLGKLNLLVKDCKEALSLFPAQPKLYLINAKALNSLKNYKNAIISLEAGLDFVIDNDKMLINFYEQFKNAYLGLGQNAKATKYVNKVLLLEKAISQ